MKKEQKALLIIQSIFLLITCIASIISAVNPITKTEKSIMAMQAASILISKVTCGTEAV